MWVKIKMRVRVKGMIRLCVRCSVCCRMKLYLWLELGFLFSVRVNVSVRFTV